MLYTLIIKLSRLCFCSCGGVRLATHPRHKGRQTARIILPPCIQPSLHPPGKVMAITSSSAIGIHKLTDEAASAAIAFGRWLSTARFKNFENYEICDENDGVVANSQAFLKYFEPSATVRPPSLRAQYQMSS